MTEAPKKPKHKRDAKAIIASVVLIVLGIYFFFNAITKKHEVTADDFKQDYQHSVPASPADTSN